MLRSFFILPMLLAFPLTAAAQTLDKDKLRKAAYWPYMGIGTRINAFDVEENGKQRTPERTIAKLTKHMQGDGIDAAIYLELAKAYKDAGQEDLYNQTLNKVEAVLRPYLQTTDPKDGHFLASYARYVGQRFPDKRDVAENRPRRAVQVAPGDWRCWKSLAWRISEPALALLAKDAVDDQYLTEFTEKVSRLPFEKETMKLPWHEIKRRLDEGLTCIQKARALANGNDEMLDDYLHFLAWQHPCRVRMEQLRGQITLPGDARMLREFLQIQEELAQRQPTNLRHQARAAAVVLMADSTLATVTQVSGFMQLPANSLERFREYANRLERAAQKADPETGAFLHENLAMMHMIVNEKASFHRHARCALQIDPSFEPMSIFLGSLLAQEQRFGEAIEVARTNLQAKATPLGYYFAGNMYNLAKNIEESEKALRRGLELDANHPHCQFALAVLLLRRSDQPGALEEAGRLLAKVNPQLLKPLPPVPESTLEYFRSDLDTHRAIHRALCGDNVEELKKVVRESLRKQPTRDALHGVALALGMEVSKTRIDRDRLRAAARFLTRTPNVGAQIGPRHESRGAPINAAKQIAKLQQELRGTPEDALVLADIGRLYSAAGQKDEVRTACTAAKTHFAGLLAKDGARSDWQTEYAWALLGSGDNDSADQLAMKIAAANPQDWKAWRNLGEYAFFRSSQLLGFPYGNFQLDFEMSRISSQAVLDAKFARDVAVAERWLDFGKSSLAKAVHLAPQEPEAWLAQVHCNIGIVVGPILFRMLRGERVNVNLQEVIAQQSVIALCRLCELAPDSPYYLGGCALAVHGAKATIPDFRKEIEGCLTKLENLAFSTDRETAGHSHLYAAHCCGILERPAQALVHARKALELIPENEIAWNTLVILLLGEMNYVECRQVLARRAERFPTPFNYLWVGAMDLGMGEVDSAEKQFQVGLKLSANDFNCRHGMVALTLARGDSPEHLAEAGRWLQKADAVLGEQKNANHLLLTGVLEGLKGNALLSQAYLRQAQELDPGNSFIKTALEAVNP